MYIFDIEANKYLNSRRTQNSYNSISFDLIRYYISTKLMQISLNSTTRIHETQPAAGKPALSVSRMRVSLCVRVFPDI